MAGLPRVTKLGFIEHNKVGRLMASAVVTVVPSTYEGFGLPALEAMGIRMLLNECETITRGDERIHLAGIDDAHYFRVDNIEKAASDIPDGEFSILLSRQ